MGEKDTAAQAALAALLHARSLQSLLSSYASLEVDSRL